jgi:hypothetical protein
MTPKCLQELANTRQEQRHLPHLLTLPLVPSGTQRTAWLSPKIFSRTLQSLLPHLHSSLRYALQTALPCSLSLQRVSNRFRRQVHPDAAQHVHSFVAALKDVAGCLRCSDPSLPTSAFTSNKKVNPKLFCMDATSRDAFPLFAAPISSAGAASELLKIICY